jgi:hypothetical protein
MSAHDLSLYNISKSPNFIKTIMYGIFISVKRGLQVISGGCFYHG